MIFILRRFLCASWYSFVREKLVFAKGRSSQRRFIEGRCTVSLGDAGDHPRKDRSRSLIDDMRLAGDRFFATSNSTPAESDPY